ncbi:MAG: hypothetical protein ACK2UB_14855, partial [Anaerolineales bacterium]
MLTRIQPFAVNVGGKVTDGVRAGVAGAIVAVGGKVYVYSTILAGNADVDGVTPNDLEGLFEDVDHCLVQEGAPGTDYTIDGSSAGNIYSENPILDALAD